MKVAIVGAGAAGCFCAVNLKRMFPEADVHVFEGASKALAKVAVTGGGRCNLTNTFANVGNLKNAYPRGDKLMRRVLSVFDEQSTWEWFEAEGVRLVAQDDECVFPQSQDAMEIVNTLLRLMQDSGVKLHLKSKVRKLELADSVDGSGRYLLSIDNGSGGVMDFASDRVVVTTGGHPKQSGFEMLAPLQLEIKEPVPSLFTFNVTGDWHQELMGTVVEDAVVSIPGTKLKAQGALLLTHWGMSGPAILRLSSYAARVMNERDYHCQLIVNWLGGDNEETARELLSEMMEKEPQKLVSNVYPRQLTSKHWMVLLKRAGVPLTQRWGALVEKHINKLACVLTADMYEVTGKCAFKEEFVTCGGVALSEINMNTMEAKRYPGLYFAGEVLDVDAVTGGFNLQAAWSMGFMVAQQISGSSV